MYRIHPQAPLVRCIVWPALCVLGLMIPPAEAEDEDNAISATLTASIVSKYLWHGYDVLDDHAAFQPSAELGWRNFALGAMYASYDRLRGARAVAEAGVRAGIEFDKSSSGPHRVFSFPEEATTAEKATT